MKKSFPYLFLLFFSLLFTSCSKKVKDTPKPVYPMAVVINNYSWNATTVTSNLTIDATHNQRIVNVTATNSGKTITMEFYDNATGNSINTGTHSFPEAYFLYNVSSVSSTAPSYTTINGSITITSNTASTRNFSADFEYQVKDNTTGAITEIRNGHLNNVSYSIIYE